MAATEGSETWKNERRMVHCVESVFHETIYIHDPSLVILMQSFLHCCLFSQHSVFQ